MNLADLESLLSFHDAALSCWYSAAQPPPALPPAAVVGEDEELGEVVLEEHRANFCLWNFEDEARRRDVDDGHIAAVKRSIDAWNQRRNDLIEAIDRIVLGLLAKADTAGAEQHSETVGMMVDRLSILALKLYHMGVNARRDDDAALAEQCRAKVEVLSEQRLDLQACLVALIEDVGRGRRFFKLYHQHKAYNDPRLNPALREVSDRDEQ